MKTTEKINIGGFFFTIEKDAFALLDKYLKDIAAAYDKEESSAEIMAAIEERIAELIMEKCGKDAVVSIDIVEMVQHRIGDPSQLAADEANVSSGGQPGESREKQPRRLYRDLEHRMLGGVCSGLAAYFNIDVVIPRLAFVIVSIIGGVIKGDLLFIGVLAYLILWLVIPAARTVEEKCRMNGKPMVLEEFSTKAASVIKEVGEEVRTSPGMKTVGKIICIIFGTSLIIGGFAGLGAGLFFGFSSNLPERILHRLCNAWIFEEYDVMSIVSDRIIYILIAGIISLTSIVLIYIGTLLAFNLKSPKWRPGIILFVLWFIAVLFLAAYIARKAILLAL